MVGSSPELHLPLQASVWTTELSDYPDKADVEYILQEISNGFRIGFDRRQHINSTEGNLLTDKPEAVTEYLQREMLLGRMWKIPLTILPRGVHISPMGMIPKRSKPEKWRLIVDLSSPHGKRINDGIDTDRSSLSYACVDHLVAWVVSTGRGYFLVKADIKEAYKWYQ